MSAVTAGFMVPGMLDWNLLHAPVFGREFDVIAFHSLQNDLTFGFKFQQALVHIIGRRNGRITHNGMRFSFKDLFNGS
jgi:hypothetical protein